MGKLFLSTGDYIFNSTGMDAIVNAQNKYMGVGGNICGLILQASGKQELLDYCKKKYKDNMYSSEVRITPGFNLKMDIIHVLAPIAYQEEEPLKKMHETYVNLINKIKEKKYKKILCCSLGTGTHKYNPCDIAEDVIKTLNDFCQSSDVEIYFNNMYPRQKEAYLKAFIKINDIDLLKLKDMSKVETYQFLKNNSLRDINTEINYKNFLEDISIDEMCLSEKLLFLQYCLEFEKEEKFENIKNKIIEDLISA